MGIACTRCGSAMREAGRGWWRCPACAARRIPNPALPATEMCKTCKYLDPGSDGSDGLCLAGGGANPKNGTCEQWAAANPAPPAADTDDQTRGYLTEIAKQGAAPGLPADDADRRFTRRCVKCRCSVPSAHIDADGLCPGCEPDPPPAEVGEGVTVPDGAPPAEQCGPPWVIFSDKGEPCAIMPAGRPGDVVELRGVSDEAAERLVDCANAAVQCIEARLADLCEDMAELQRKLPAPILTTDSSEVCELVQKWQEIHNRLVQDHTPGASVDELVARERMDDALLGVQLRPAEAVRRKALEEACEAMWQIDADGFGKRQVRQAQEAIRTLARSSTEGEGNE